MNRAKFYCTVVLFVTIFILFSCSNDNPLRPDTVTQPNAPLGPASGFVGQSVSFSTGGATSNKGHEIQYRFDWGNGSFSAWGESSRNYSYISQGRYVVRAQARSNVNTSIESDWSDDRVINIDANAGFEIGTMIGNDGRTYQTIKIGNQWWMAENLRETKYRDGTLINCVTGNSNWASLNAGAYCAYNNDAGQSEYYGHLYNWYAVNDGRQITSSEWHVPTDDEWKELEKYLGVEQGASNETGWRGGDIGIGSALKGTGTQFWNSPNAGTNQYGFNVLPAGERAVDGMYKFLRSHAIFWSHTSYDADDAWYRSFAGDQSGVGRFYHNKQYGFSVRLVKGPGQSVHVVSTPTVPSGPNSGSINENLSFSTNGAVCNQGHSVEYRFDWGDGNYSSWGSGAGSSHSYTSANTYSVRAQARCQADNSMVSNWSSAHFLTVSSSSTTQISGVCFVYPSSQMLGGVTLTFSNGGGTASTDNTYGYYEKNVPYGWSGRVTPSKAGYVFNPPYRDYTNVTSDIQTQDYWHFSAGSHGIVKGIVKDANTDLPIQNVKVQAINASGSASGSSYTDSNGSYELNLAAGSGYTLEFSKAGYISVIYGNVLVRGDETLFLETVIQIANAYTGNGTVGGQITNAIDGQGVNGVTLYFRQGLNMTSGSIVAQTATVVNGSYNCSIPAGNYTVEVVCENYNTTYFTVICVGGQNVLNQNSSISPVLASGEIRVVLSWGASPYDLDSHMTGPISGSTQRFHVYYSSEGSASESPFVFLDWDDTEQYGPETITIKQQFSGNYRYSVHNYSDQYDNSSYRLSNSGAKVQVYQGANLIRTFNVPQGQLGTLWTVFELNGTVISPVNTVSNHEDPATISKAGGSVDPIFHGFEFPSKNE